MINKSVFLDTSFLIASQVQGHKFLERTIELRKQFVYEGFKVVTSQLVFDEFWYVLIGLGKAASAKVGHTKLFGQIKKATTNILSIESLNLLNVDLTEKELLGVLEIMYKFNLRPRDAITVKLMRKAKIKYIASFDKDFDNVKGISRLS